jgi:hypothetical protein
MNEFLKVLGLKHVEKGLPELCEQARMHSLTGCLPSCDGYW